VEELVVDLPPPSSSPLDPHRQYDEACKYFDLVLSVNPNSASAYSSLGVIYHLNGKIDDAIVKYHQALAIAPDDSVTLEMLEQALGMKPSPSTEKAITDSPAAATASNNLVSPRRKQKQHKDSRQLASGAKIIDSLLSSLPVDFQQVSSANTISQRAWKMKCFYRINLKKS
jgi:tetratricopeptide (TPR) repeat protein